MRLALAAMLALAGPVFAETCENTEFDGSPFTVCAVTPGEDDIRLWLRDETGQVYGTFDRLNAALEADGLILSIAMNGGMYHDDRRPVGHYVEAGVEEMRVVAGAGPGNFGLVPNGVLCLTAESARVFETSAYLNTAPDCDYASQSGPMLVIDGQLHPKFREDSTSSFLRNGLGVHPDGTLYLAISNRPVTFHHFARLFRDGLETPNALFIDGNVSRLYARALDRHDIGLPLGPILGTVRPVD